ncbi:type II secretion system protein [Arcobacter sp. LA11]|uniref:type II secretion system protein n=1 Tax=Arcobacter sp. LA11 TaxID=1898176 RepID=UPI0009F8D021|nr:prepilin-type N-terminal cleavage/methylation domain-containing protein [Arcobacter sp. LA11]
MKSAFSLFELIVVLVILSILTSFIVSKVNNSIDSSLKTKVKSEIALIRNSIAKYKTKKILLGNDAVVILDNAQINSNKSLLFKDILNFPLVSTSMNHKVIGSWIKKTSSEYIVYLNSSTFLEFKFENDSFICKSDIKLCKEYE